MSLGANLVARGGCVVITRLAVRQLVIMVVGGHEMNVRTDLVSAHHMMW
jgi:hypothetical protein